MQARRIGVGESTPPTPLNARDDRHLLFLGLFGFVCLRLRGLGTLLWLAYTTATAISLLLTHFFHLLSQVQLSFK